MIDTTHFTSLVSAVNSLVPDASIDKLMFTVLMNYVTVCSVYEVAISIITSYISLTYISQICHVLKPFQYLSFYFFNFATFWSVFSNMLLMTFKVFI